MFPAVNSSNTSYFWASLISTLYIIFLPGWSHIYYLAWRGVSVRFMFLLEKLILSSNVRLSLTSALPRNKGLSCHPHFISTTLKYDGKFFLQTCTLSPSPLDGRLFSLETLIGLVRWGLTSLPFLWWQTCVAILYKDKHWPSIHFQSYKSSRVVRGTLFWPEWIAFRSLHVLPAAASQYSMGIVG